MTYTDTRRRYLARRAEYLAELAEREAKRELRRTRYRRTMGDRRRESERDADCGMLAPVVLRCQSSATPQPARGGHLTSEE